MLVGVLPQIVDSLLLLLVVQVVPDYCVNDLDATLLSAITVNSFGIPTSLAIRLDLCDL
jgi:hypothetical protein